MRRWLPVVFLLFLFSGCYNRPVRHLASDVGLITPGKTTKEEVLLYLGEPDTSRRRAPDVEEFVYTARHRTGLLRNTPLLGRYLDENRAETVVVTITDGVVTDCRFTLEEKGDRDWADDFTWKEIR